MRVHLGWRRHKPFRNQWEHVAIIQSRNGKQRAGQSVLHVHSAGFWQSVFPLIRNRGYLRVNWQQALEIVVKQTNAERFRELWPSLTMITNTGGRT